MPVPTWRLGEYYGRVRSPEIDRGTAHERAQTLRYRVGAAVVGAITIAVGLGVRAAWHGMVSNVVGVALWDTLVCCALVFVWPRLSPRALWLVATLVGLATEGFQLTGVPILLQQQHRSFALVFGTTFEWIDLVTYPIGAALGAAIHAAGLRLVRRAT